MGKPERKRSLGRPRRRWEDNIEMELQEVGCEGMDWIDVARDRDSFHTSDHNYGAVWTPEGAFSKGQTVFLECLTPNMKTLECLSMSKLLTR